MTNPITGKGMFMWPLLQIETGNPDLIARAAEAAGLSHALIKIADGVSKYPFSGADQTLPVAAALHARGVAVLAWHYVYGLNPEREADIATERLEQIEDAGIPVAAYVVDAEVEYKGRGASATKFMNRMRSRFPALTIALSTYRYPTLHPTFPYLQFLQKCDLNSPQVYWIGSNDPAAQLRRCIREYAALSIVRPMIPTGAAFRQASWSATPAQATAFLDEARAQGLAGANFWEWSNCKKYVPQVWDAIAAYSWAGGGGELPPPPPPPVEPPPPGAGLRLKVVQADLRVRSAPSRTATILGYMQASEIVAPQDIGGQDAWVRVAETAAHPAGWANVKDGNDENMEAL